MGFFTRPERGVSSTVTDAKLANQQRNASGQTSLAVRLNNDELPDDYFNYYKLKDYQALRQQQRLQRGQKLIAKYTELKPFTAIPQSRKLSVQS